MSAYSARNQWFEEGRPPPMPRTIGEDQVVRLRRSLVSGEAIAAGLSPDCRTAFLTTEGDLELFSVNVNDPNVRGSTATIQLRRVRDAAISDDTVCILTRYTIELYRYDVNHQSSQRITRLLEVSNQYTGSSWIPLCVGICAAYGAHRIAIAGERNGLIEVRLLCTQNAATEPDRIELLPLYTYNVEDAGRARTVSFGPNGDSVAVVTTANRVLVWHIRNSSDRRPAISISTHGPVSVPKTIHA